MKTAIAIDLKLLRAYMVEFIAEREQAGDLTQALTLSSFLVWLINKEKTNVEEDTPSVPSIETYRWTH